MNKGILGLGFALSTFVAALGGCTTITDEDTKEDLSSETGMALVQSIANLGEIPGTGEVRTARYANPPRYAAYSFFANGGEEVDAWVRGQRRADAVAWILDAQDRIVAYNDDAPEGGTLDAHLQAKLPASLGTKAKLRVVFREYRLAPASFDVSVRVKPGMFTCTADDDCVKVRRGGCCSNGWVSVNASRADDYAAQNTCKPPYPPCAPGGPGEQASDQVALCEAKACVLGTPRGCLYNGVPYNVGDSFPSSDGCNTCSCGPNGSVGCTKRACIPGCLYNGVSYNVGDSFPSSDGCNTCSCGPNGSVACTKRACVPTCNPDREPNRKYVAHSPEQCMLVRFACEPNTVPFSNACGCGCEQAADCPEFINCMPGPGVTSCGSERTRCPFTPVAF